LIWKIPKIVNSLFPPVHPHDFATSNHATPPASLRDTLLNYGIIVTYLCQKSKEKPAATSHKIHLPAPFLPNKGLFAKKVGICKNLLGLLDRAELPAGAEDEKPFLRQNVNVRCNYSANKNKMVACCKLRFELTFKISDGIGQQY